MKEEKESIEDPLLIQKEGYKDADLKRIDKIDIEEFKLKYDDKNSEECDFVYSEKSIKVETVKEEIKEELFDVDPLTLAFS